MPIQKSIIFFTISNNFLFQIKKLNIDLAKLESEVVVITEATKDDPVKDISIEFLTPKNNFKNDSNLHYYLLLKPYNDCKFCKKQVSKFARQFCKTGSYLRPDDMKFCVDKTNFTEDQASQFNQAFLLVNSSFRSRLYQGLNNASAATKMTSKWLQKWSKMTQK